MNRNQLLLISLGGACLLAIPASQMVWSKAHVPLDQSQVCHAGVVKQIVDSALKGHLGHGDCRLPVCDFNNTFFAGDSCADIIDNIGDDGFCDSGGTFDSTRDPAEGVTPACTNPW